MKYTPAFVASLDGAANNIPLSLGCVALVYAQVGPGFTVHAIAATLLGLAVLQLVMAGGQRPILFSARFFEATTLAAMLHRAVELMPSWQLGDTPAVRLALLCLLVGGAGVVVAALYLCRADRASRHIPGPVFAGFSNSIAVVLLVTEGTAFVGLLSDAAVPVAATAGVAALSFAACLLLRLRMARWPAAGVALALGTLAGVALSSKGVPMPVLGAGHALTPPAFLADFAALRAEGVRFWPMAGFLLAEMGILGLMVFINSSIAAQAVSHLDERDHEGLPRLLAAAGCMTAAGALGAAPMSGGQQATFVAMRTSPMGPPVMVITAMLLVVVALSGVLGWVPHAAVAGVLACEALFMADRGSVLLAWRWLTRRPTSRHAREDLALIFIVTAVAGFFNMVAAVVAGLLLGLLLFAARQLAHPVRSVSDGAHMTSNCARSRADVQALATHGHALKVVELEGDLFFGTLDALHRSLREAAAGAVVMVVDWSEVRNVDTSVVHGFARFQRDARAAGLVLVHVEPHGSRADIRELLSPLLQTDEVMHDLDRALEAAENHLLHAFPPDHATESTSVMETLPLLRGMSDADRAALEAEVEQRMFAAGETIMAAGEPGDHLMVVLQGSGSVLTGEAGHMVRVAGVRRGAMLGELAFLDRAPRSATVVANEATLVAILDRAGYERLCERHPPVVQKLLANIAAGLAVRLRHTTRLAARRDAHRYA